ncbi:MAG: hypothetical protein ACPHXR_03280 [Flavicella sp.]
MTPFVITCAIITVGYLFYSRTQRLSKIKNSIYEISSYSKSGELFYYIVMEQSHGKFIDSRKLPNSYKRLLPSDARSIIEKSYSNENEVINALETFKKRIK